MKMNEYISKETILKNLTSDIEHHSDEGEPLTHLIMRRFIKYIEDFPAADVQPVKRGYWKDIMMSEATGWDLSLTGGKDAVCETVCSVCGGGCAFDGDGEALLSQYCPDCGAKMIMDGDTE